MAPVSRSSGVSHLPSHGEQRRGEVGRLPSSPGTVRQHLTLARRNPNLRFAQLQLELELTVGCKGKEVLFASAGVTVVTCTHEAHFEADDISFHPSLGLSLAPRSTGFKGSARGQECRSGQHLVLRYKEVLPSRNSLPSQTKGRVAGSEGTDHPKRPSGPEESRRAVQITHAAPTAHLKIGHTLEPLQTTAHNRSSGPLMADRLSLLGNAVASGLSLQIVCVPSEAVLRDFGQRCLEWNWQCVRRSARVSSPIESAYTVGLAGK